MNLEDTIKMVVDIGYGVLNNPTEQNKQMYNLIVKGIEINYQLNRTQVIKLLYDEANKNNFYKGLEDNG